MGVCIFGLPFSVVYVEGAAKFTKHYKRLLLHRVDCTETTRKRVGWATPRMQMKKATQRWAGRRLPAQGYNQERRSGRTGGCAARRVRPQSGSDYTTCNLPHVHVHGDQDSERDIVTLPASNAPIAFDHSATEANYGCRLDSNQTHYLPGVW
jgi:hypothetical protein